MSVDTYVCMYVVVPGHVACRVPRHLLYATASRRVVVAAFLVPTEAFVARMRAPMLVALFPNFCVLAPSRRLACPLLYTPHTHSPPTPGRALLYPGGNGRPACVCGALASYGHRRTVHCAGLRMHSRVGARARRLLWLVGLWCRALGVSDRVV